MWGGYTFAQVCSILTVEPYNLSFAEISRLTAPQIREVLFCPRDEKGEPIARLRRPERGADGKIDDGLGDKIRNLSWYWVNYWLVWRWRGLEEDEVRERWKVYLRDNPDTLRQWNEFWQVMPKEAAKYGLGPDGKDLLAQVG